MNDNGITQKYRIGIPKGLSKAIVDAGCDWLEIRSFLTSKEGYDLIFQRQTKIPAFFRWGAQRDSSNPIQNICRIELEVPIEKRKIVREQVLRIVKECVTMQDVADMEQLQCRTLQLYKRKDDEVLRPFYVRRVIDAVKCCETTKKLHWLRNSSIPLYMSLEEIVDQVNTGQGFHSYGDGTYMIKENVLTVLRVRILR